MKLVEFSSKTPEENIAFDELLLAKAEKGEVGETLRFWISREKAVILGRAGKVDEDCVTSRCSSDGVKIIRRISGGGTVLQGEGCLNYSLVLSYAGDDGYGDINGSYRIILGKIADKLKEAGLEVGVEPVSDLALSGKKISGNAQARKKSFFLHHGTLLYDFDLESIARYLKYPAREPEYRKGRSHFDFVMNIPAPLEELKGAVSEVFSPKEGTWLPDEKCREELDKIVKDKYSARDWNRRF